MGKMSEWWNSGKKWGELNKFQKARAVSGLVLGLFLTSSPFIAWFGNIGEGTVSYRQMLSVALGLVVAIAIVAVAMFIVTEMIKIYDEEKEGDVQK